MKHHHHQAINARVTEDKLTTGGVQIVVKAHSCSAITFFV